MGRGMRSGLVAKAIVLILLIDVALIYVHPILYMLSTMMMSTLDLVDPTIRWIPTELYWDNLVKAFEGLEYWRGLGQTVFVALIATAAQTLSCAVAGYGFAQLQFSWQKSVVHAGVSNIHRAAADDCDPLIPALPGVWMVEHVFSADSPGNAGFGVERKSVHHHLSAVFSRPAPVA